MSTILLGEFIVTISKAVAKRIIKLLNEKNMTQYNLEQKMFISHSAMNYLLSGNNKNISLNTIFRIVDCFNINILNFFDDNIFYQVNNLNSYIKCIKSQNIIHFKYINVKDIKMKEEVGKRLLECRKASKMTQQEVANLLGVAQPVYQRFERGIFECSYEQLYKLSEIFDVSIDFLLGKADL